MLRAAGMTAALGAFGAGCGSNTGRGGANDAIQQWYHAYSEDGVRDAVQRFAAEYPDGDVEVQWNQGDYDSTLNKALLSGSVPDVYEAEPKVDKVRAGQAVPLDDLLGDARSDFTPAVLDGNIIDGKLWAIPQTVDTQVLYYRKSLLSDAGVRPPETVDELLDATRATAKGTVKGLFLGNDGGASVLLGPLLWSAGLDFLRRDGERYQPGFDEPVAATALGKLRELNTGGGLLASARKDWSEPDAFLAGQVAMQWCGLWALPEIERKFGDDFGALPWPKLNDSGAPSVPVGAFSASVNGKSTKVDAAKEFVRWLWVEQTDKQQEFSIRYGFHIPARASLVEKATSLTQGPAANAANYVQQHGKLVGGPYWTDKMDTAYLDALTRIGKEGADPATELRSVNAAVSAELNRLSR